MSRLSQIRLLASLLIGLQTAAFAAPQAQPGDVGRRHDNQGLADYGAIGGPVTTWPISWDAVLVDLEYIQANDVVLPNKVLPTFNRILARAQRETARGEFGYGGSLAVAEEPAQIRGFSNTPREKGELRAGASWFSEYVSLDLNVSAVESRASSLPQYDDPIPFPLPPPGATIRRMVKTSAPTAARLASISATGRSRRAPTNAGGARDGMAA